MTWRASRLGRAVLVLMVGLVALTGVAQAAPSLTGPVVTVDRTNVAIGARIVVSIDGFTPAILTISICGNEARRGSADCNMAESEGLSTVGDEDGSLREIKVVAPPAPCPCVVRVANRDVDEVAVAPIVIDGHPIAPVVDPETPGDLVEVTVIARSAPNGFVSGLRADFGGPATYDVTISVKNLTMAPLRQVQLAGSATRGGGDGETLVTLDLADPDLIGVGQTWQQTITTRVPAPSFGAIRWQVTASGAGGTVSASSETNHRPILLMVAIIVVVLCLVLMVMRWRVRRHALKAEARERADEGAEGGLAEAPEHLVPTISGR